MAVRIELDTDHALGADDGAHALDDVAFNILVTERHHGAVQAKQYAVERQRRAHLGKDFVPHGLVVLAVGGSGGAGRKATALNQYETVLGSAPPGDEERRRAHARRIIGVFAGSQEYALLVGGEAGRQW